MCSIFQTPEWEKFKLKTGYQKSYRIDNVLVLQKNLPLGFSMLYSPMVGEQELVKIKNSESKIKQEFIDQIKEIARQNKSIFYRLELDISCPDSTLISHNPAFIKSFEEMQPEHTLIINISKQEQEILQQMKQKGRYNIKIAEKHEVNVSKSRKVDNFFTLYQQTAKRQKITYRQKEYFKNLLDILEPKGYCEVFEAYVKNENEDKVVLASAIIIFYKGKAIYLYGASSNQMRNFMAPYKLHWEIIKDAKSRNCQKYDMFGVAPPNKPKHPWSGVTSFKEKFGGSKKEIIGSIDLVFNQLEYNIFKIAEKIRR